MKPSEIRAKGEKELEKSLLEKKGELFAFRLQHGMGQLTKTTGLKNTRRDIARIMTIAREKTLHLNVTTPVETPVVAKKVATTKKEKPKIKTGKTKKGE